MVLLDPDLSDLVALLTKLGTKRPRPFATKIPYYLHALVIVTSSHS